jgi:hypothetical protein
MARGNVTEGAKPSTRRSSLRTHVWAHAEYLLILFQQGATPSLRVPPNMIEVATHGVPTSERAATTTWAESQIPCALASSR